MNGNFEETGDLKVNVDTTEIFIDLHYPIKVGKGENAREIKRMRFHRPNLNAMEAVERVAKEGNSSALVKEICKQIGEDADSPGVLVPSIIGQLDVADFLQISRETEIFFLQLKEKADR